MMSNEPMPMPIADADVTTTWTFTVDVSGKIMGIWEAKTGDSIMVTNASGSSFIGNVYALETSSGGDQTVQLLGVDSIQVDKIYTIVLSVPPEEPTVEYRLSMGQKIPLATINDSASGTLRVGGG
jgi:hypothetical protein